MLQIERALSDFVNDHSGHHKTAKKEVTETHLAAAGFGNANATSTTNIYEASPPETTPLPTTTATTGPYVTPPGSGCYRLVVRILKTEQVQNIFSHAAATIPNPTLLQNHHVLEAIHHHHHLTNLVPLTQFLQPDLRALGKPL